MDVVSIGLAMAPSSGQAINQEPSVARPKQFMLVLAGSVRSPESLSKSKKTLKIPSGIASHLESHCAPVESIWENARTWLACDDVQNVSQCAGRPAMSSRCKSDTMKEYEGVAIHIDREPCAVACEGDSEASAEEHIGQPLSPAKIHIPGADAVAKAEGDTDGRVSASGWVS